VAGGQQDGGRLTPASLRVAVVYSCIIQSLDLVLDQPAVYSGSSSRYVTRSLLVM